MPLYLLWIFMRCCQSSALGLKPEAKPEEPKLCEIQIIPFPCQVEPLPSERRETNVSAQVPPPWKTSARCRQWDWGWAWTEGLIWVAQRPSSWILLASHDVRATFQPLLSLVALLSGGDHGDYACLNVGLNFSWMRQFKNIARSKHGFKLSKIAGLKKSVLLMKVL